MILTGGEVCSVESCVNKTIIWLYVFVSESLFNVSIVSRLIYTNCVIDSICTPFALFLHRFNQDFRESIHVEVVRVLCARRNSSTDRSLFFRYIVHTKPSTTRMSSSVITSNSFNFKNTLLSTFIFF